MAVLTVVKCIRTYIMPIVGMAVGGVLQVTLLVTVVLCYLMAITRGDGLFQHTGRNLIPCNKLVGIIELKRVL